MKCLKLPGCMTNADGEFHHSACPAFAQTEIVAWRCPKCHRLIPQEGMSGAGCASSEHLGATYEMEPLVRRTL